MALLAKLLIALRKPQINSLWNLEIGNGLENNRASFCSVKGWQGYWIEGSERFCKSIRQSFEDLIASQQLTFKKYFHRCRKY
jgi:hypothetical protein